MKNLYDLQKSLQKVYRFARNEAERLYAFSNDRTEYYKVLKMQEERAKREAESDLNLKP